MASKLKFFRAVPYVLASVIGLAGFQSLTEAPVNSETSGKISVQAPTDIDAGRYIAALGGCNDCHTDGYAESGGQIPESNRLTGSSVGWRGPWGTSYPSNLRLLVQEMPEDAWVGMLRTRSALPPMPWPSVNNLSEPDSRALYRYIRSLGSAGAKRPSPVAAGQEPATAYILLEPLHLERLQAQASSED